MTLPHIVVLEVESPAQNEAAYWPVSEPSGVKLIGLVRVLADQRKA